MIFKSVLCVTLICEAMMIGVDVYRIVKVLFVFLCKKAMKHSHHRPILLLLLIHVHIGPTLSAIIIIYLYTTNYYLYILSAFLHASSILLLLLHSLFTIKCSLK